VYDLIKMIESSSRQSSLRHNVSTLGLNVSDVPYQKLYQIPKKNHIDFYYSKKGHVLFVKAGAQLSIPGGSQNADSHEIPNVA